MSDRMHISPEELAKLNKKWSKENLVGFIVNPGAATHGDMDGFFRPGPNVRFVDFPLEDKIELKFKSRPHMFEQPFREQEYEEPFNELIVVSTFNFFWKHPLSYFDIDKFLSSGFACDEEPFADRLMVKYDDYKFRLESVSFDP